MCAIKCPWFHGNDDDRYAGISSFCVMDLKNAILSLFLTVTTMMVFERNLECV